MGSTHEIEKSRNTASLRFSFFSAEIYLYTEKGLFFFFSLVVTIAFCIFYLFCIFALSKYLQVNSTKERTSATTVYVDPQVSSNRTAKKDISAFSQSTVR